LQFVGVDLKEDFSLNETAMLEAIEKHKPAVTFLAYPNNPTGNLFGADVISRIIEKSSGLVIVDEAYFAFSPATFVSKLGQYPNLLVMRTVSKLGLAGLRLGLLAGPAAIISELHKIRLPYNINVLSQKATSCVLKNYALLREQIDDICAQRTWLSDQLKQMKSLKVFNSDANFILFRALNANELFEGLKRHGILIKNVSGSHSLLSNCLRVTVGSHKENEKFVDVMQKLTDKS
jgi:histidinol-phosphate aminotransferase